MKAAINEYFNDFFDRTKQSGEKYPEVLIYQTTKEKFQNAGFYGAQLDLKEKQVNEANSVLRDKLKENFGNLWRLPFKKWADIINNFLGSLVSATGFGEALKELKDCLRNELPDDND